MLKANVPALVLAPMEGITDAAMRGLQSETGNFTFVVSEFLRVSGEPISRKVFLREIPELRAGGVTDSGVPIQVQLLGGDPDRMAQSAIIACQCGATGIDINFGCPAPTVNRHDGGATLLKYPVRIREIVEAIRSAVPDNIPVSAKLRLGWDNIDAIYLNAEMVAEGGASWITIHARTRMQAYAPPVYWGPIAKIRSSLDIPVIGNGDIWTIDDFKRRRDETGCIHFMIGRGSLANPRLSAQIAQELGLSLARRIEEPNWELLLQGLIEWMRRFEHGGERHFVKRLKQWLRLANQHGDFRGFDSVKRAESLDELFTLLRNEAQIPVYF